jgi:glycine/D-amino acid oxidase-like deaminating enzyme
MGKPHRSQHDVIVVGSRCAGAATAMLLARAGHDVTVLDRSRFPSDVLSTHGLVRGGVVQLSRWGLLEDVLASGAPAVRQVTFRRDDTEITRRVKERAGVDLLVAPRRHVLDALPGSPATATTAASASADSSGVRSPARNGSIAWRIWSGSPAQKWSSPSSSCSCAPPMWSAM